jgi:hypothetical protein
MPLPERDTEFLDEKCFKYSVTDADGWSNLVIDGYVLPECYAPREVRLLIRLPVGYPTTPLDMFFTIPRVVLVSTNSAPMNCTGEIRTLEENWQQWSRHFPPEEWRPRVDCLRTFFARIKLELSACR